jgi:hypothetical protein
MINNLIVPTLTDADVDCLAYVNPYWAKEMNRYVNKATAWTHKFRGDYTHFELTPVNSNSQLPYFTKKLAEYKNYIMQKYEMIATNLSFVRKFRNFVENYCVLIGITNSIKMIADYYRAMEHDNIDNKHAYLIQDANKTLWKWWQSYTTKIKSLIPNDEYLDIVFNDAILFDDRINSFEVYITKILVYCRRLLKKKKITENQFILMTMESIEFTAVASSFSYYASNFIKKVY